MKQIIHVAQEAIRKNTKEGTNDPAIICRTYQGSERHHEVEFVLKDGTVVGKMVYSPHKPLSCGARLWLTLDTDVCYARPVEQQEKQDTNVNPNERNSKAQKAKDCSL